MMVPRIFRPNRYRQAYSPSLSATIINRSSISLLILTLVIIITSTAAPAQAGDAWMMYRVMGLDDLRLSLSQLDLRLESLTNEAARTRKLAAAGAVPQVEVIEREASLAMATAERDELSALVAWQAYLLDISKNNRAFVEEEYFRLLLATLEPRVRHAVAVVDLMEKRHAMNTRLIQRKAISSQDFEISTDELAEARARQLFYRSQAIQARHALDIRQNRRDYIDAEAETLAKAVNDARLNLWQTVTQSIDHRLARLQALKSRGLTTQSELDSADESRKSIQKAMDDAQKARPEPYPAPGQLKRPPSQFT